MNFKNLQNINKVYIINYQNKNSEKRKNPKYYQYLRFKTLLPKNSLGWECFFDSFFIYFFLIYVNIYKHI